MNNFYKELTHIKELTDLFYEIKDLYLMVTSANQTYLESLSYKMFDRDFIAFNILKIPFNRFPKIKTFLDTPIGQNMGSSVFFTETDTRQPETKQLIEIHNHAKPALINFPLINCDEHSLVHFYNRNDLKNIHKTENGLESCDLTYPYIPAVSYSSKDGCPYVLNAKEFHSVENNGISRRITFGWHFKDDIDFQHACELTA